MTTSGYVIEYSQHPSHIGTLSSKVYVVSQFHNGYARDLFSGYFYETRYKTLESFLVWKQRDVNRKCIATLSVLEMIERVSAGNYKGSLKVCCLSI